MDFIHSRERLTTPLVRKNGELVAAGWEEALAMAAARFTELGKTHGSRSLGALGASNGTNEENYLLQKFVRAAFGCNNVDSGARLRTSGLTAGIERILGVSAMTNPISHIGDATEILVIGADPLVVSPLAGEIIRKAVLSRGAHLTLVDPLPQGLTRLAQTWIQPRPGACIILLAGLLNEIVSCGLVKSYLEFSGLIEHLRSQLGRFTRKRVEDQTGIEARVLEQTAVRLAGAQKLAVIPCYSISREENSYSCGVMLACLALLTGNVWKPGCGLFALAATLNDQGAMDMGAVPDKLPGHQLLFDPAARTAFEHSWGATLPTEKGLDYVSMIEAAEKGHIAGLYVVGENPVMDCPETDKVLRALSRLEFLVVQDRYLTETAGFAHVVLPSASFAEKNGTWTSIERRVQRSRQAIAPIGRSRPDWAILADLMRRMRVSAPYREPQDVLLEINETVPIYRGITLDHLEAEEVFWPCFDHEDPGDPILYFHRPALVTIFDNAWKLPDVSTPELPENYPFWLIVKESMDSLDRAAFSRSSTLRAEGSKDHIALHPSDAAAVGIDNKEPVIVTSRFGSVKSLVYLSSEIPPGIVLAVNSSVFTFNRLFAITDRDPASGAPWLNRTAVNITRLHSKPGNVLPASLAEAVTPSTS
jgi:predicted molibdopterin-dependent oxidoreductase YjgC